MKDAEIQELAANDPRLAAYAASRLPAWLWSADGQRILWANPAGLRLFGAATIVFGLSENFLVSLVALVVLGASDMVSVFVRSTLIQAATPDAMRGRVSAVSMLFVGASNELGEFESGGLAYLVGTVPAVVIGGLGTLGVVGLWMWLFPDLRKVDRLSDVKAGDQRTA